MDGLMFLIFIFVLCVSTLILTWKVLNDWIGQEVGRNQNDLRDMDMKFWIKQEKFVLNADIIQIFISNQQKWEFVLIGVVDGTQKKA